jgi:hypothetical protein
MFVKENNSKEQKPDNTLRGRWWFCIWSYKKDGFTEIVHIKFSSLANSPNASQEKQLQQNKASKFRESACQSL